MADLIHPRQREAAAILLIAVDLPAPMLPLSRQIIEAESVKPGMSIGPWQIGDRKRQLERVREIVDQLLAEIG